MFEVRAFCNCGWSTEAWRGSKFFIDEMVCPDCGSDKMTWTLKTVRWINTSVWYKPKTWGSGFWQERPKEMRY